MYSSGSAVTIRARFRNPDSKLENQYSQEPNQSGTLESPGRMRALNATLKEPKTRFDVLERRQRDTPNDSNYV
jgi:hypothetical protein